jgi:cytochrome c-type biogenesis protein
MDPVSYIVAFLGGLIAFFSPCVLPLVPPYISLISGISIDEIGKKVENKWAVGKVLLVNSIAFCAGFSLVFVLLGAGATIVGKILVEHLQILNKIAGVLVAILGLHISGIFRIKYLYSEKRMNFNPRSVGVGSSFVGGMAFSFGWTPCVGPILGAILAVAAVDATITRGMILLALFSLGMTIPFIGTAILMGFMQKTLFRSSFLRYFEIISGIFLIIIGVLLFTGKLQTIMSDILMHLRGMEAFKHFLEQKIQGLNH